MCTHTAIERTVERTAVDAFGEKMLGVLNGAATALMTSVGHRTGLFDTMTEIGPSPSEAIASRAALDERYVREWLGAMTAAGIVSYDAASSRYRLPEAHAALLTRAASPDNLAVTAQFIAVLGSVEDRIVECFRRGGGVPYEAFERFHAVMADDSDQTVVSGLIEHVLPLAPGLEEGLREGIDVVDVGCGRGRAVLRLAEAFPASRFVGIDLCDDAIAAAREEGVSRGIENASFEVKDAATLETRARYDLVTAFDAIHDQADPATVLANIHGALRADGWLLMQDISASSRLENNLDHPVAPFLYTISCMHCMTVSLARGGVGLGAVWGRELALDMLREAGFAAPEVHSLEHDFMNDWYVARR